MIEQQVADRFREAVADEPPLGFDPDDVIDRAIKRRRRRAMIMAVVGATAVEAAVVWSLSGSSGGGEVQPARPAPVPGPAPAQPSGPGRFVLTGFDRVLNLDHPTDQRPAEAELQVDNMLVRNPDRDRGTATLKRGDQVVFEISLNEIHDYDMHLNEPIIAKPGVPVTLAVNCTASIHQCQGVSLAVSGYTVVKVR